MPFNGAGTYAPPAADFPVITLTTVSSTHFNNTVNDLSTGISNCLTKDGQTTWTANQPAGGFKISAMGLGALRTDSARIAEIQDGTPLWGGTAGGTGDALTLTMVPQLLAYLAPQVILFKTSATNTGASTMSLNALATKAIQKNGVATVAGDLVTGRWYFLLYDGTNFQIMGSSDRVTLNGTETLTNKTLTAPTINGATITGGPTLTSPKETVQTLAAGASIAWDMSLGTSAVLTLGAAANAIANPTNLATGQWGWLTIKQDATGTRTIASWGTAYKFVGGVAPISSVTGLSTAASAVDRAYWICDDGATVQLTFGKGFA